MTMKWEMPPQTSLTCHQGWYMAVSSLQANTIKPHRSLPWDKLSSMALSRSMGTISVCIPLMTPKPVPWPPHPLSTWTNRLPLGTLKHHWSHSQSRTFLDHPDPQCHTSHIQACHHPTSTIAHACQPQNSLKNLGSYQETTGSTTSRASHRYTPTPSQDSEEGWWRPLFTSMTSSPTIPSSFCHEDVTASSTRAHSEQGKTHTLKGCLHARKRTPSTLRKHLPPWSISLSSRNEMRPYALKYNASGMRTIGSEIWPKSWPISRSSTMTPGGKSTTPYMPWPMLMPSTDSSHTSFTMPR
jgi:hypothetical protein